MIIRLYNLFKNLQFFKYFLYKYKYTGVSIDSRCKIVSNGRFSHGDKINICKESFVLIDHDTELNLSDEVFIGSDVQLCPIKHIKIGNNTSIQDRSIIVGNVSIGAHCLISYNVLISSGGHSYDQAPYLLIKQQDRLFAKNRDIEGNKIVIGDDCWIGINVVIMPGISIGKGAVIGANSVVTKNIPPYTVVAGSPAKEIKKRLNFSPPREIHYENEMHIPYFYSGFIISIERDSNDIGYQTTKSFTIALSAHAADYLFIKVRALQGSDQMIYKNIKTRITESFQTIKYTLANDEDYFFNFSCEQHSGVIFESAWVE